jgi:hypothetical protein
LRRDASLVAVGAASDAGTHLYFDQTLPRVCSRSFALNCCCAFVQIESVPPNGIIPFHRQVMFAAPICFLFDKVTDALQSRLWSLRSFSDHR